MAEDATLGQPLNAADIISERLARFGSIPFDEFVDLALYAPNAGFFALGGGAGRAGADFLTSPEVGPLFGAVLARFLDQRWTELGRPDPFVVVEAAAGRGALALAVLKAQPLCGPALRYVLVERSADLRARQGEYLSLAQPFEMLGPVADCDDPAPSPVEGIGPLVCSLSEMPSTQFIGVVLANELLDNIPFRLVEKSAAGWSEVRVTQDASGFIEMLVPCDFTTSELASILAPDAQMGARIPLQGDAAEWVTTALGLIDQGSLLVVDYGVSTSELSTRPQSEWLRTYAAHGRSGSPLEHPGSNDITTEVGLDQIQRGQPASSVTTQAQWLADHGINQLVDEGRRQWDERAGIGDLAAIAGRSRVIEAEALTDLSGLGSFAVLEWRVQGDR